VIEILGEGEIDEKWGLDHGAWSVLTHTHKNSKTPILQLSLDLNKSPQQHYELAKKLKTLRKEGFLIIGSGNIVHNLKYINLNNKAYEWQKCLTMKL